MKGVVELPVHVAGTALEWHGFTPFQIVSLLDMIRVFGNDLYTVLYQLESFSNAVQNDCLFFGADSAISPEIVTMWTVHSDFLVKTVEQLKLKRTSERLDRLIIPHAIEKEEPVGVLKSEMLELKIAMQHDLAEITFFYMPPDHLAYYMGSVWSGIWLRLSNEIDAELLFAGRCFSTENYTAAVFHLMRAVEAALKMVVRKMRATKHLVTTIHGGKTVIRKPVELCDWETIIRGLEKALKEMEKGIATNRKRRDTYEYYSGVIASFRNFKDAWRNKVSHSNKLYSKFEAAHIVTNTQQFLEQLLPRFEKKKKETP